MEQVFELLKSEQKFDYLMKRVGIIILSVLSVMVSSIAYGDRSILFSYFVVTLLGIEQVASYRTVITSNSKRITYAQKFAFMPADFKAYRQKTIKHVIYFSLLYTVPGGFLSIAISHADGVTVHLIPRLLFMLILFISYSVIGSIYVYINLGRH